MNIHLRSASFLALLCLPAFVWSQVIVTFGTPADTGTTLTHPTAVQGTRNINSAFLEADFFGSASLIDGTLRAKVSAMPKIVFTSSPSASVGAQMNDRLKVLGPGTAPVPLQLRMDIDALLTVPAILPPSSANSLYISASIDVDTGGSSTMEIQRFKSTNDAGAVNEDFIQCWTPPCNLNQPLTLAGVVDGQIVLNVMLSPGFFYPFRGYLNITTSSSPGVLGQVDASQTARLSYTLPPGYTLTSQSGVFLSAVPEPDTWALWAAGLCAVVAGRLRGTRGVAHA